MKNWQKTFKIACDFTRGNRRRKHGKCENSKIRHLFNPILFLDKKNLPGKFPRYPEVSKQTRVLASGTTFLHVPFNTAPVRVLPWKRQSRMQHVRPCNPSAHRIQKWHVSLSEKKDDRFVGWFCWDGFGSIEEVG